MQHSEARKQNVMESGIKPVLIFLLLGLESYLMVLVHSESIIKRLPGYPYDLPFKLETGYVGVGKKKDVQLFYYFVESTRNPKEDPVLFYVNGGPGASCLVTLLDEIGPLSFNLDDPLGNISLILNPNAWTKMANIIFVDILAGAGFSYAETKEGWNSSDSNLALQAIDFIKQFLINHPMFLTNPLYVVGISYAGIVVPKITLDIYEGNECGDQPTLNIQGYILHSPLTDKFKDSNSRFEYAHRMALISDDIYKLAINTCNGNYVSRDATNFFCLHSLQLYEQCISRISLYHILETKCDATDITPDCHDNYFRKVVQIWANTEAVQRALNIRQGKIEKWELTNKTMHYYYNQEKGSICYDYDIFSSFDYHKELVSKNCQALIVSGDHDITFPYVGVVQWIYSLNLNVEMPWYPFYVDGQVGGYEMKYAKNKYSLTFATVKGAGHSIPYYRPKETMALTKRWFSSQTYSSDS